jgi:hypothetical protein
MSNLTFEHYELTQMSKEELLDKAVRLYSFISDLKTDITLQLCVDKVIRTYSSYNPDEEKVGTYA